MPFKFFFITYTYYLHSVAYLKWGEKMKSRLTLLEEKRSTKFFPFRKNIVSRWLFLNDTESSMLNMPATSIILAALFWLIPAKLVGLVNFPESSNSVINAKSPECEYTTFWLERGWELYYPDIARATIIRWLSERTKRDYYLCNVWPVAALLGIQKIH